MALFFSLCENNVVLHLRMSGPCLSHVHVYYIYPIYCSKHLLLHSHISIIVFIFNLQEVRI